MKQNTIEQVKENINIKTGGRFRYIDGYKNKSQAVRVKCTRCGEIIERTYHHITTAKLICPTCTERERNERNAKKQQEKNERQKQRKEKALVRKIEIERKRAERKRAPAHECPVCGSLTKRAKYCSDKCKNKAHNTTREHKRRARIKEQIKDKDITLIALYERDNGRCHICGGVCSWEDKAITVEAFIAGAQYPSIDHIVPISKGGAHAWDNIRLAHRSCNTKRGANISPLC